MKTIDILINPAGQITINANGFEGADCEKATAFLEQALGELKQRQRKPEYHRRVRRQQQVGV
jgi:hypothetical protein